ncbi:MAG: hypothetical protein AB8B91_10145 [Rubripirellula sp.]
MLDRASTFANPEIVHLLKTRFLPVALDQHSLRRQQDSEGDFYRKIVLQRSGKQPNEQNVKTAIQSTTQGFYIATASGDLLLYNNNRNPEKVLRLIKEKLQEFDSLPEAATTAIQRQKVDSRYNLEQPEGGLTVRVRAKVLGGYEKTDDQWQQIFQSAVSRDNLWISKSEHQAIVEGRIPDKLLTRIARFHLVDNTRGEPPMWNTDEIEHIDLKLKEGQLQGSVRLKSKNAKRGYEATLKGTVEVKDNQVIRFDMIALGDFWGDGPYTRNAPKGKFPLAISFSLADGKDVADDIPPQGARGWVDGYLR